MKVPASSPAPGRKSRTEARTALGMAGTTSGNELATARAVASLRMAVLLACFGRDLVAAVTGSAIKG